MIQYQADLIDSLTEDAETRIVYFIIDGLGGLSATDGPETELEAARLPNLDQLASEASTGLHRPVSWGVTPGSGPGHLALFGYDPVHYEVGRGLLEAAGIEFTLQQDDLAVRGNFATLDEQGKIIDRRAGRLSTPENERLCRLLQEQVSLEGVQVLIEPVKEHRLLIVFRGPGLSDSIADTDPQETAVPPLAPVPLGEEAIPTVELVKQFLQQVREILAEEPQANMVNLRGFARYRLYPSLKQRFGLDAFCLANYPMYRGVASLIGMDLGPIQESLEAQLEALETHFSDYDFFFIHVKAPDKKGEDGDFAGKVRALEEIDHYIPSLLQLKPDVLVVTGDHCTPSAMRGHSWHPVPVLIRAANARRDAARRFTETECLKGALGQFPARHLMALSLAHAGRLKKFGA